MSRRKDLKRTNVVNVGLHVSNTRSTTKDNKLQTSLKELKSHELAKPFIYCLRSLNSSLLKSMEKYTNNKINYTLINISLSVD